MLSKKYTRLLLASLSASLLLSGCATDNMNTSYMIYTNNQPKAAFDTLHDLAHEGDRDAQFLIARMYSNGEGVKQDKTKAIYWYARAAEQNQTCALNNLGLEFKLGLNVPRDDVKALQLIQQAAQSCYPAAVTSLGEMYYFGQGVAVDKAKALELFQQGLDLGSALAAFEIGRFYTERSFGTADQLEGFKWLHIYHLWDKDNPNPAKQHDADYLTEFYRKSKNMLSPKQQQQAMRLGEVWYKANKHRFLNRKELLAKCFSISEDAK